MKDSIRYAAFTPQKDLAGLSKLVACYQDVFADDPWNEWRKCNVCNMKWGTTQKSALEALGFLHCGQSVTEFWPAAEVQGDILREVTETTSCWVAYDADVVVGFCWGYAVEARELEKKLKLPGFADAYMREFGRDNRIAYQDEIGVRTEYRGHGIAKQMFYRRLDDFRRMNLSIGVVRTKTNPPSVTNTWLTWGIKSLASTMMPMAE